MKAAIHALLLTAIVLSVGCTKEEPRPRPQDMVGDPLAVEHTVIVKPEEWEAMGWVPGEDIVGFTAEKDVYAITEDVLAHGQVKVYLRISAGNWRQLPALRSEGAPGGLNWRFTTRPGQVQVRIDRDGEACEVPPTAQTFKVVVVPG